MMRARYKFFLTTVLSFVLCFILYVPYLKAPSTSNFRIEILPITPPTTTVIFKGIAAPSSYITLLKDGQIATTTQAGPNASFEITITGISAGLYVFTLYGDDTDGRRTSAMAFAIYVTAGVTTQISGIFLSPTIDVDKEVVSRGEVLTIFGKSDPSSSINVYINAFNGSTPEFVQSAKINSEGLWIYNLDTTGMDYGDYGARARASLAGGSSISDISPQVEFKVEENSNKIKKKWTCPIKGDLNLDCKVNVIDLSIFAFWWGRSLTDWSKQRIDNKLKKDGVIDIKDLSVMAYYWTG